jgi:hypothetical protein
MYCPLCGAEYRPGFTVCSDCQVALVPDPARAASADPSIEDESDDTSFVLVWSGSDALKHTEICEALDRQKIPARTLGSEDHLFNLTTRPAFEVYVPADLANSAREAIQQVDPLEDSARPSESDIFEIPAEDGPSSDDDDNEERRDSRDFDPQDATVEIWSGQDANMAAMIASSLRENSIPCRSESDTPESQDAPSESGSARILVFPEDERRAKEITREIIDAVPPQ